MERVFPYIEPNFSKVEYNREKPTILLISAMGASGKTTTARALAFDTNLPILDLAKHPSVGANTLTGILTSAYPIEKMGEILQGLRKGQHGVIIDGIDEGRSKTTAEGFYAFLDDILTLSDGAESTTIVIFGRSQALIDAWCHFMDKKADVGLMQIEPFSVEQAKCYIDAYSTIGENNRFYADARDHLLEKLKKSFDTSRQTERDFLSFIGYPPVLDSIATLLRSEKNYHLINQQLNVDNNMEIDLLIKIAEYLMNREHKEKAKPNFISKIKSSDCSSETIYSDLFGQEEQCARILAFVLGRKFPQQMIPDKTLNAKYEDSLKSWLPEHPFLENTKIRNPVFESIVLSKCIVSERSEYQLLAHDYVSLNSPSYLLLYILESIINKRIQKSKKKEISAKFFNVLLQSCSEILGLRGKILTEIDGEDWEDNAIPGESFSSRAELKIIIQLEAKQPTKTFSFLGIIEDDKDVLTLGPSLVNIQVKLPCAINLVGSPIIECVGICDISVSEINLKASELIFSDDKNAFPFTDDSVRSNSEDRLIFDVGKVGGQVDSVQERSINGTKFIVLCREHTLSYPLRNYVQENKINRNYSDLSDAYLILRRILLAFRSHSKGSLARYKDKIEHKRILKGELGKRILEKLLSKQILISKGNFYHINPSKLSEELDASWEDLKRYNRSEKILVFLSSF